MGRDAQRQARVLGCADPGAELVERRLRVLREHRWSSWRVYAGLEMAPSWLNRDRIQGGCGGRGKESQRAAWKGSVPESRNPRGPNRGTRPPRVASKQTYDEEPHEAGRSGRGVGEPVSESGKTNNDQTEKAEYSVLGGNISLDRNL